MNKEAVIDGSQELEETKQELLSYLCKDGSSKLVNIELQFPLFALKCKTDTQTDKGE